MKISSWNVNSIRARIVNVLNYLKSSNPDILMIQEIKTEEKNFPFNDFKNLGYKSHVFGQKSYNGVAFLSKINIDKISLQFIKDKNNQSRIIVGDIKNKSKVIKLVNIYVPNGNPIGTEKYEYKKNWYDSFIKKVKKALIENGNIIIGGDFNVIPEEIDVYDYKKYENDALFKLEIRKKYRELINLGLHDIYRYLKKDKQMILNKYNSFLQRLARVEIKDPKSNNILQFVCDKTTFFLDVANIIDLKNEEKRIIEEMEKIKIEIDKINKMLRNSKFIKNAPDEVVKKQKENFMNYKNTLTKLEEAKKNIPTT